MSAAFPRFCGVIMLTSTIADYLIEFLTFFFGLCVGSFMNVCIFRLPNSQSIVHPRSMCPTCGKMIKFYDNIPVLSFLLLKRKCRYCNAPISFRYPLVEIMGGFFAVCVYLKFGITLEGLIYYFFIVALLVITFIDIDHQIIPDRITLPGIPLFFLASFAVSAIGYKDSILGLLVGGGSLFAVAWTYHLITKREGMGGGDIKLLAMIGTLVGWQGVLFTIFVASAVGTFTGVLSMI
ncbi:MAG: prepilin peptidase, partial [Calditrichales bacterium]